MNRLGIKDKLELNEIYIGLKNKENIEIEGIFSHFATLGINDKEWDNQLEKFKEITSDLSVASNIKNQEEKHTILFIE